MRGVDVGANPQARVGDADAGRCGPPRDLREHRRGLGGLEQLLGAQRPGRSAQRRARPATVRPAAWSWLPARDHQLARHRARDRDLRRTDAPPPSRRAAARGAARARRRAGRGDRCPASRSSSAARSSGRRSTSIPERPPRCRSETISVRISPRRRQGRRRPHGHRAALARLRTPRRAASRICLGSMKRTSSRTTSTSEMSRTPRARKNSTSSLDEVLGRAGAGGDADDAPAVEPLLAHLARVVDQVRVGAAVARDLDEAHRSSRSCASRSRASGRSCRRAA